MKKLKAFTSRERIFLGFLILAPEFWWIIFKLPEVFRDLLKLPFYLNQKIFTVFTEERLVAVGLMRWANIDDSGWLQIFSKVIYNRLDLIIDEFFNFLSYISPRIYFQAGDGSIFTPPGIEPLPILLFPLFLFGLINSIKKNKTKPFLFLFIFTLVAYSTGIKNFSFLLPIALIFIWFSSQGFLALNKKHKSLFIGLLIVYSIFLGGRMIWLS